MYIFNKINVWENTSKEKCLFSKDFSRKISIGRYRNKTYKHFINLIKTAVILLTVLLVFSCGGGGGGGAVSFQGSGAQYHNGGDASGWGTGNQTGTGFNPQGQGIEESEAGLLISQMAALSDITGVTIELTINGTPYPAINADETTTTAVLPKIKAGDKISGKATIYVMDGEPRVAFLDETEATLHGVLKFKVPYHYDAYDLSGGPVSSGTYYARDGINLSTATTSDIAGWQCVEDGTTHYGSYVTGVRGDITLNAVTASGAPVLSAVSDKTELYAKPNASFNDTATLTISNGSGSYTVTPDASCVDVIECTGSGSSWTVSIKNDTTTPNSTGKVMFADNMNATINVTDTMNGGTTSVSITLKNKYSLEAGLSYTDSSGNAAADTFVSSTEFNAGDTLDYSTIALSAPSGRQIVAYKHTHPDTTATTIYKTTTTPPDTFTFSSALGRRNVYLSAVLDFTCSRSDGGYETTASPLNSQTGTSTNPYLLHYYGNDTNKRNQIELEISDNNCADSALTIGSTQTAIFNATFDITHTGNKFLIKIKPSLAESAVYTSDTIKLTITDPTTGAKKDIHVLLKKVRIGNKNAPDAVGDIVFNDGSAMSYTYFNNLDAATKNEKKVDAIALIFYKGSAGDALGAKMLGVGLKHDRSGQAVWCTSSADAYDKNIDTIQCTPSVSAGAYTFSGDKDGSDNFSKIAAFAGVNDTGTDSKYRAFYFAKNYKGQKLGSESSSRILTGSEFEDGWYLPSIAELFQIYANGKGANKIFDIDAASQALGVDSFGNAYYSSSSQYDSRANSVCRLYFGDGTWSWTIKDTNDYVCAVRAF